MTVAHIAPRRKKKRYEQKQEMARTVPEDNFRASQI